jgi:hypothetical protein
VPKRKATAAGGYARPPDLAQTAARPSSRRNLHRL